MHSQPTTPRDRRALSNLKHGLTGKIYLLSQADQLAYDDLCRGIHESMAPEGAMELELVQSIADDRWRLRRAATLESSIFADAADRFASDPTASTGDPEIDGAISGGRTWIAEARNLNLLTLYESRIQRRFEKNMAILGKLQAERKAALEKAVAEAAALAQLAESKGEAYDPSESFLARGFEFSAAEIAHRIDRWRRLNDAKRFAAAPRKALKMAA